jgi:hypothetical protein
MRLDRRVSVPGRHPWTSTTRRRRSTIHTLPIPARAYSKAAAHASGNPRCAETRNTPSDPVPCRLHPRQQGISAADARRYTPMPCAGSKTTDDPLDLDARLTEIEQQARMQPGCRQVVEQSLAVARPPAQPYPIHGPGHFHKPSPRNRHPAHSCPEMRSRWRSPKADPPPQHRRASAYIRGENPLLAIVHPHKKFQPRMHADGRRYRPWSKSRGRPAGPRPGTCRN